MYAIASVIFCTALAGCLSGTRDPDAADVWVLAPTAEECEARNLEVLFESIEEAGDVLLRAHVRCERIGA